MRFSRLQYIIKHNTCIQKIYRYGMSSLFRFWGLFLKTDDNLVLFNGLGYMYNDSPRAIYEKMLKEGIANKYKIVWALNDPGSVDLPGNAKKVQMDSLQYFKTALQAKYWISCVNIERGLKFKKRATIYLNTWHGASLNYVGNAVGGRNDFHFEHVNYFCYNGEYEREFIKRDFNVRDEALIPTGYPRNDVLYKVKQDIQQSLRNKLGVPTNKKVILYAPTWRESQNGGNSYKLAPPIDWGKWKEKLQDQYVVFLRAHHYTTELMNVQFNDFVRNYSNYPNVNDLLIIADILISDYSSIQLDYAILGRPQICFGYDYDEYKATRGFYFDMQTTMPNGVMKDEDQVIDHLLHLNYEEDCKKSIKFRNDHMEYGGNAAITCIQKLFENKGDEG